MVTSKVLGMLKLFNDYLFSYTCMKWFLKALGAMSYLILYIKHKDLVYVQFIESQGLNKNIHVETKKTILIKSVYNKEQKEAPEMSLPGNTYVKHETEKKGFA